MAGRTLIEVELNAMEYKKLDYLRRRSQIHHMIENINTMWFWIPLNLILATRRFLPRSMNWHLIWYWKSLKRASPSLSFGSSSSSSSPVSKQKGGPWHPDRPAPPASPTAGEGSKEMGPCQQRVQVVPQQWIGFNWMGSYLYPINLDPHQYHLLLSFIYNFYFKINTALNSIYIPQ